MSYPIGHWGKRRGISLTWGKQTRTRQVASQAEGSLESRYGRLVQELPVDRRTVLASSSALLCRPHAPTRRALCIQPCIHSHTSICSKTTASRKRIDSRAGTSALFLTLGRQCGVLKRILVEVHSVHILSFPSLFALMTNFPYFPLIDGPATRLTSPFATPARAHSQ